MQAAREGERRPRPSDGSHLCFSICRPTHGNLTQARKLRNMCNSKGISSKATFALYEEELVWLSRAPMAENPMILYFKEMILASSVFAKKVRSTSKCWHRKIAQLFRISRESSIYYKVSRLETQTYKNEIT